MISCFTSTHRQNIHCKSSNRYQILSPKDCQKILLTKKFLIQQTLKKSGYNFDLKYTKNKPEKPKMQKQNIIWFNPPFIKSISANTAKTFLHLVTKHFPKTNKFHKIFNCNAVKFSMSNKSKIIEGNNKKVTLKACDQRPKCDCRKKGKCPMEGNCQVNGVDYKYDVTRPLPEKVYLDLQRENQRAISITTNYYLNTRDTPRDTPSYIIWH